MVLLSSTNFQFEEATKEVADEITQPRPEGEEEIKDIQILVVSDDNPIILRNLKSEMISNLVKVSGIIVSASGIRSKATKMSIQCRGCQSVIPNISIKLGLDGFALPRKCNRQENLLSLDLENFIRMYVYLL